MRSATTEVSDFLDNYTTGAVAHLVTITLKSGHVERLTDYEMSIEWGGVTWVAGGAGRRPIVELGSRKEVVGTEVGTMEVVLFCGHDSEIAGKRLTLAALDGDFRGAWAKVERVFLAGPETAPIGVIHLFEGPVAEAQPSSTRVDITIESGIALLNLELPKVQYQPGCVHMLFDAGCGLAKADYEVSGTVGAGATTTSTPTALAQANGHFALGVITFTSGANAGTSRAVRTFVGGTFTLDRPLPVAPAQGDGFTVYPGCDKTFETCHGRFVNAARFRGFPYVPRNENGRLG